MRGRSGCTERGAAVLMLAGLLHPHQPPSNGSSSKSTRRASLACGDRSIGALASAAPALLAASACIFFSLVRAAAQVWWRVGRGWDDVKARRRLAFSICRCRKCPVGFRRPPPAGVGEPPCAPSAPPTPSRTAQLLAVITGLVVQEGGGGNRGLQRLNVLGREQGGHRARRVDRHCVVVARRLRARDPVQRGCSWGEGRRRAQQGLGLPASLARVWGL